MLAGMHRTHRASAYPWAAAASTAEAKDDRI
jgi:hypothetical protein